MNKDQQELKNLSVAFASEISKLKQLMVAEDPSKIDQASSDKSDPAVMSQIQSCMSAIYSVANNLHNRIDRMQASMYAYQDSHAEGHPYKLLTATHKQNYLKATGMQDDYEKPAKKWAHASKDLAEIK